LRLAFWPFINVLTALMAEKVLLGNRNQAVGTYLHGHLISPFNNFSSVKNQAVFGSLLLGYLLQKPVVYRPCLIEGLAL
jgi:hypothetical protein